MHLSKKLYYVYVQQSLNDKEHELLKKRASPNARVIYIPNPDDAYVFQYKLYEEIEVAAFIKPYLDLEDAVSYFDECSSIAQRPSEGLLMLIGVRARSARGACRKLIQNDFRSDKSSKGVIIKEFLIERYQFET